MVAFFAPRPISHTSRARSAVGASLRQHATIVLSSKWPVTTPVIPGIIKMTVGRWLDAHAITVHFLEPALAFPVSTETIKIPIPRNLHWRPTAPPFAEAT